jgi:hypothetical protein
MAPELSGRELLHEWQRLMDSVVKSAASAAGHPDLPRQLVEPMQRQVDLLREIVEKERRVQSELAAQLLAPFDAVFDLLEESATSLRHQGEALESAARALEETAGLMKGQAELFERTIGAMRQPAELAKRVAGVERRPRKGRR